MLRRAAADDQHVGARDARRGAAPPCASRRGCCRWRWRARGRDARRRGDEHRVGERHPHHVRQRPAPVAPEDAEAIHRARGHGRAVAGLSAPAARARAARDLERHDDAVARRDAAHVVADLGHLGHELVAERDRARERRLAAQDRLVEVAQGDRQRAHERLARPLERGLGDVHHSTCRSTVIVSCCIRPPGVAGAVAAGAPPRAARRHSPRPGEDERAFEGGDGEIGAPRGLGALEAGGLQALAQWRQPVVEARLRRDADRLAARRDLERGGGDRAPRSYADASRPAASRPASASTASATEGLARSRWRLPRRPGRPRARWPRPRSAPCRPGSSGTASPAGPRCARAARSGPSRDSPGAAGDRRRRPTGARGSKAAMPIVSRPIFITGVKPGGSAALHRPNGRSGRLGVDDRLGHRLGHRSLATATAGAGRRTVGATTIAATTSPAARANARW